VSGDQVVYAALSKALKGKGGAFLCDMKPECKSVGDLETQKKLWNLSMKWCGIGNESTEVVLKS